MDFFELDDDLDAPGRWFLGSPVDRNRAAIEPEVFTEGTIVNVAAPLTVSVRRRGIRLDWTFAEFDMPVVSVAVAKTLRKISPNSLQLVPAMVERHDGEFFIANVLDKRACLDEGESEFLKWSVEDARPDRMGHYRQVSRLRINSAAVEGVDIFRVTGWEIALVVSEQVKNALEAQRVTGIRYVPV